MDQLHWMAIPRTGEDEGAKARVYSQAAWGPKAFRTGEVVRLRPGLEEQGRMARLLIAVADPLARQPEYADLPRMILSAYVRVEIEGTTLHEVATISRSALRDGDCVYLMADDDRLEIRRVQMSVISMMGIVALSGVVVNDALVMINYANQQRRAGQGAFEAIHNAGVRRFRPILLTTLTTFGGPSPMIFETSRQAGFMIPMALSLGYGIIFATAITLLLVPCLYMILEDVLRRTPTRVGRRP